MSDGMEENSASQTVEEPIDLIRLSLDEEIFVQCRGGREIRGKLICYDEHLNLVLESAEETAVVVEEEGEERELVEHERKRGMDLVFVRGDGIVMVSPPVQTA